MASLGHKYELTHLPQDKMAAISQTIFSDAFFVKLKFCVFTKISLKFVHKGPIDDNPALVEIMAWRRTDGKHMNRAFVNTVSLVWMMACGISGTKPLYK